MACYRDWGSKPCNRLSTLEVISHAEMDSYRWPCRRRMVSLQESIDSGTKRDAQHRIRRPVYLGSQPVVPRCHGLLGAMGRKCKGLCQPGESVWVVCLLISRCAFHHLFSTRSPGGEQHLWARCFCSYVDWKKWCR